MGGALASRSFLPFAVLRRVTRRCGAYSESEPHSLGDRQALSSNLSLTEISSASQGACREMQSYVASCLSFTVNCDIVSMFPYTSHTDSRFRCPVHTSTAPRHRKYCISGCGTAVVRVY